MDELDLVQTLKSLLKESGFVVTVGRVVFEDVPHNIWFYKGQYQGEITTKDGKIESIIGKRLETSEEISERLEDKRKRLEPSFHPVNFGNHFDVERLAQGYIGFNAEDRDLAYRQEQERIRKRREFYGEDDEDPE